MRLWVLPRPYWVSIRMIEAISLPLTGQPDADGLQEFTNPARRETMPEEDRGVGVFLGSRVVDNLSPVVGYRRGFVPASLRE